MKFVAANLYLFNCLKQGILRFYISCQWKCVFSENFAAFKWRVYTEKPGQVLLVALYVLHNTIFSFTRIQY